MLRYTGWSRCCLLILTVLHVNPIIAEANIGMSGDTEIVIQKLSSKLFEEPLVATRPPIDAERLELVKVLKQYRTDRNIRSVRQITDYLDSKPDSPWTTTLSVNIGLVFFHAGHITRAIALFERAWRDGKDNPKLTSSVNRAFAELLDIHTRLGHAEHLARLLAEAEHRSTGAYASEPLARGREGLWQMQHDPASAFRCGQAALASLLSEADKADQKTLEKLLTAPAGEHGTTLGALSSLAQQSGFPYIPASRTSSQYLPVPSVMHLKQGHYVAVLERYGQNYRVHDPVFGSNRWLSADALNDETSGYFLIHRNAKPLGWRTVSDSEASSIVGAGFTKTGDPSATTPEDSKDCDPCDSNSSRGMPTYSVHSMLASLHIEDTPIGYSPPKGPPINITFNYSERDASQPATFTYSNLGPKWTLNWISYIQDDPANPLATVTRAVAGGGYRTYTVNPTTATFPLETRNGAQLVRVSSTVYERRLPDGSKEVYSKSDGHTTSPRRIFLTSLVDNAGNTVTVQYDAQLRLSSITDAIGQRTTFQYTNADPLLITGITDPFGRKAVVDYDGIGRLAAITDVMKMQSYFNYYSGPFRYVTVKAPEKRHELRRPE